MRTLFTSLLCLTFQLLLAQQVLIPYQKGNLFGLSDVKGKLIIPPTYDQVKWASGTWFETRRRLPIKDTLEIQPGRFFIRNTDATLTGLINNGKVILADEPFNDYEIIAHKCIAAKADVRAENLTKEQFKKYGDKKRFYSLFNLQGKNLYPQNFKRIQKIDTAGSSGKLKGSSRYILFVAMNFDDRKSLFVFDADKQEISEWLVKDALQLEADARYSNQGQKR